MDIRQCKLPNPAQEFLGRGAAGQHQGTVAAVLVMQQQKRPSSSARQMP